MSDVKSNEYFEEIYKKLDNRIKDLSDVLKDSIIPDTETKLKNNIFTTVIVSFFAGVVTGMLIMVLGGHGRKK